MGGEVHDSIHAAQSGPQLFPLANVSPNKLKSFCKEGMPRGEIVIDHHVDAVSRKLPRYVAADVSCPTCDQNSHSILSAIAGRGRDKTSFPRFPRSGKIVKAWRVIPAMPLPDGPGVPRKKPLFIDRQVFRDPAPLFLSRLAISVDNPTQDGFVQLHLLCDLILANVRPPKKKFQVGVHSLILLANARFG
jgi:hypothetical protein